MREVIREDRRGEEKIFPIHPMIVHFPIALWVTALLFDLASLRWGNSFVLAAYYMVFAGDIFAALGALAGIRDYVLLPHGQVKRTGLVHALLMVLVTILFVVNAWLRADYLDASNTPGAIVGMAALGVAVLGIGGWLGHKLIIDYGAHVHAKAPPAPVERPARIPPREPVRP